MEQWERFVDLQEKKLGKETTDRWLRSLKVVHFDACNLYLEARDSFQLIWFEEQIRALASRTFVNNNHRKIKIHLTTASPTQKTKKKKSPPSPPATDYFKFIPQPLDPYATLAHFVYSDSSLVVEKLISEQTAASTISPIYICGPAACGKTHLLMGIAHLYQTSGLSPFYITAEALTDQLVNAIRRGLMQEFRKAYRHADVLLIDDVHELARRNATQEELFHTFNALHASGKQIYLASRLPPKSLVDIEARLVSRFEWGITLELNHLSQDGMQKALADRATSFSFSLPENCIDFLVKTFPNNMQSLLQALNTLILRSHLDRTKTPLLDPKQISELLADLIAKEAKHTLTPTKITEIVATFYNVSPKELLSKSQSKEVAFPRKVALYFCRKELTLPFVKIGNFFGRDHSTVIESVKYIENKLEEPDKELVSALAEIKKRWCYDTTHV